LQSAGDHDGLQATDLLLEGSGNFTLVNDSATNLITNMATVGTVAGIITFENDQTLNIDSVDDNSLVPVTSNGVVAQTVLIRTSAGNLTINEATESTTGVILLESQ